MRNPKIITEHWGKIDPLKIEDYLNVGGYAALKKFIAKMDPQKALDEVKISGLSGKGGAGFLTGAKWEIVAKQKGEKYFICNLDESEPGTYKDRLIAENNPQILLEGIILAALTVGAKKSYIYLNGNFEKAREILERAIEQAKENKFLGSKILGSKYLLEIEIFSGAGAYICGEETALINSIEGNRGEPKIRPPYPTEAGLFGKPTVVNNAETIANVPWIIQNGGGRYSECATKLFVLGGAVKKRGVAEAPIGTTMKKAIEELGGGMQRGKDFWFAQVGGAAGRLYLEKELDAPITGSGAILVVDKTANLYDLLLSWTGFFRRESCGKCVPCREGTFRLNEIVERLADGEISDRDKEAMLDILWTLENTTFCPLGKFAATAVRDAVDKLGVVSTNYE
ncbi:MAG: SLBB domain-containing protein [Candidatus Moranbacteria bacterium]|nr:SLBB domain-containing protein [Candidatus Moranbacteria bacterium]